MGILEVLFYIWFIFVVTFTLHTILDGIKMERYRKASRLSPIKIDTKHHNDRSK